MWRICIEGSEKISEVDSDPKTQKLLHKTIKKVTDDLNNLRFNTVVSHLMIFVNHLQTLNNINKNTIRTFLQLMNPLAPHITEEINEILGYDRIASSSWPTYNSNLIEEEKQTIAVQFNGKTRGTIEIDTDLNEIEISDLIKKDIKLSKYLDGFLVIKLIKVPNRLINFVLKPE